MRNGICISMSIYIYIYGICISMCESISLVKLSRPTTHNVQVQRYMDAITFWSIRHPFVIILQGFITSRLQLSVKNKL